MPGKLPKGQEHKNTASTFSMEEGLYHKWKKWVSEQIKWKDKNGQIRVGMSLSQRIRNQAITDMGLEEEYELNG